MPWTQTTNWSRSPTRPAVGQSAMRTRSATASPAAKTPTTQTRRAAGAATPVRSSSISMGSRVRARDDHPSPFQRRERVRSYRPLGRPRRPVPLRRAAPAAEERSLAGLGADLPRHLLRGGEEPLDLALVDRDPGDLP